MSASLVAYPFPVEDRAVHESVEKLVWPLQVQVLEGQVLQDKFPAHPVSYHEHRSDGRGHECSR